MPEDGVCRKTDITTAVLDDISVVSDRLVIVYQMCKLLATAHMKNLKNLDQRNDF
jgi:hypothetical protein